MYYPTAATAHEARRAVVQKASFPATGERYKVQTATQTVTETKLEPSPSKASSQYT